VPRRAGPPGALTAAVGATRRLPCAARLGVARRNSLRSLRELRSDNRRENDERSALRAPTPKLRCSAPQTARRAAQRGAAHRAPAPGIARSRAPGHPRAEGASTGAPAAGGPRLCTRQRWRMPQDTAWSD